MASKIIDALIITLGLDATNYNKGSKQALQQLGQTRTAVVKSSNEMGKAISGAARSFALAFVGFNSASGLVRMLTGLNEASRQLGILARITGTGTQDLKNYSNAFAVMGGTAESFLGTMQAIQKEQFSIMSTGVSGWAKFARVLGVESPVKVGPDGVMRERDQFEVTNELANAFQRLAREKGQAYANSMGLEMGFDQNTMNVLVQGADAIAKFVAQQKQLAQNAEVLAQNAERLRAQWMELQKRALSLAGVLLEKLQPAAQDAFKAMLEFGEKNGPAIIDSLSKGVSELARSMHELFDWIQKIKDMMPDWMTDAKAFDNPSFEGTSIERFDRKLSEAYEGFKTGGMQGMLAAIPGTWQNNKAKYIGAIDDAASRRGIPKEILEGIAQRESSWDSSVISGKRKSSAGAIGLMQLKPSSFPENTVGSDPFADIELAAEYLQKMYKQFGTWERAVAAYNVGPGALGEVRAGKRGLPPETANYVNALFGAGAAQRVAAPVGTGSVLAPSSGGGGQSTTVGTINIYPSASTGEGVRLEAARAIERRGLVNQADYGVRP